MDKKRVWTIVMVIGIVMIACAVGLVFNNALSAQKAKEKSDNILLKLEQAISYTVNNSETNAVSDETQTEEIQQSPQADAEQPLPVVTVDEQDYIGTLHIPALELDLPIMSEFSYENLKIVPARYYGGVHSHDLVICAHNYEAHFGRLKTLQEGDSVMFMDMNGKTYSYAVSAVETIEPTDIDAVVSGESDLILLTCTPGGSARVIVRCDMVE